MLSVISLGAAPLLEYSLSQQIPDSPDMAYQDCERLIKLIRLKFGDEPQRVKFVITSPPVAIPYYVVECYFDNTDFRAVQYLIRVKIDFPKTWDDILPKFVSLNWD